MKYVIVLFLLLLSAVCAYALEVRSIPAADITSIAQRNAQQLWGKVFADEPIPLYDNKSELLAWQYNFSKGKPFPAKDALLERIKAAGNSLAEADWNTAEFGCITLGARTDKPVIMGYADGLSYEYTYAVEIDRLAKQKLKGKYDTLSQIFISFGSRWSVVTEGGTEYYVKAFPPAQMLTRAEFLVAIDYQKMPAKHNDYSAEWAEFTSGRTISRTSVYVPHPELMPSVRWSFGCSPTAGATVAAYWDNTSRYREGDYSTLVGSTYFRRDNITNDDCFHLPDALPKIADFMDTDGSGSTMPWNIDDGMQDFFSYKGHSSWCYNNDWVVDYLGNDGAMYTDLMTEIDWGNPTIMNIYGHTVTGYGYNPSSPIVAIHNSNSPAIDNWHISEFLQLVQVHPRPKEGCSITLLHPDGGHGWVENGNDFETYQAGSIMEISWETDYVPNTHVEIYYTPVSAYGNDNWWEVITLNAPNTGSYGWNIPAGLSGADFRVLVQVLDAEGHILGADGSYGCFTINPGGTVQNLVDDVSIAITSSPTYYRFPTASAAWTVAGLRKPLSINGDTSVQSKLSLFDQNFSSQLVSSSSYGKVNWVAVDRNHVASAHMGLKAELSPYTSQNELEVEGGMHSLALGANSGMLWLSEDVVKMWNVPLSAGTYCITLETSQNANLGFGLCSSVGSSYYHSPATLMTYSDNGEADLGESVTVTITQADTYGLIVWANADYTGFVNISIGYPGYWTGNVDTNWSNAANWATGVVPTATSDVVIPYGADRYPVINYPGAVQCRDLIINTGATLHLRGNLTVNGSATIGGSLMLGSTNPVLNIDNNLTWNSTADGGDIGSAAINISGNWLVNSGAEVQFANTTVNFIGSNNARLQVNSATHAFYHLNINKSSGAEVLIDPETDKVINILGNLTVGSSAKFVNTCDYDLKLYGNLSSTGGILFQNCLLHIFNRVVAQSLTLGSSDVLYSLKIDNASGVTLNSNLTLYGSMFITQGSLNAGNRQISVYGSWYNDAGDTALVGANHTVQFVGNNNEECYETGFKNLELAKGNGAELQVPIGKRLVCQNYNWSSGALRVKNGAEFKAAELADIRIMGRYFLEGGLIELHQDTNQYVDLDADIYIYSGTFNIYGGANYPSEWAYTRTITVHIEDGVLDFKNNGIYLRSTGYYLNDFISGGIIRSSGDFKVERPGFNPSGGIVEMSGSGSSVLHVNAPSTLYNLTINKSSREQNQQRINMVSTDGNTTVNSSCTVTAGVLQVNNAILNILDYLDIYGAIAMNDAQDFINTGGAVVWRPGSNAVNLSGGTMKVGNTLMIDAGCQNFCLNPAVNFVFAQPTGSAQVLYVHEPSATFGTITIETLAQALRLAGNQNLVVSGDLVIKANATLITQGWNVTVAGKIDIWQSGTCTLETHSVVLTTNLYNSGLLNLPSGYTGSLNVSGTFLQYASGSLALHGGSFIINTGYTGSMYAFGGTTNMSGGILQISNNGMQIGASGFNFTGGTIKLGWSFMAANPTTFQANAGTLEMIGEHPATINLANGNYLPYLVINKAGVNGEVSLATDILVGQNLAINTGKFITNQHKLSLTKNLTLGASGFLYNNNSTDQIEIGGTWTNNGSPDNFVEGTGLVTFITSSMQKSLATNETFYRLAINTGTGMVTVSSGKTITIQNNLEINSGKFRPLEGTTLNVQGNMLITGANSYLDQNFRRETSNTQVQVGGNLIVNGGTLYSLDTNGDIPTDIFGVTGNFEMTGGSMNTLDLNLAVQGNFSTTTTTLLETRGGVFTNTASGTWQYINCPWTTYGNTIEFTNKGLQFVSGANLDNNSETVFKTGKGLYAITDNVLCEEKGTFEFIGSVQANINLGGNNTLPSVKINKNGAAVVLSTNATITGDVAIQSGNFNSNNYTLVLRGNWTNNVGSSGYSGGASEVICRQVESIYNQQYITGSQSFYKLTINHPACTYFTVFMGSNTTIQTDLTVNSGGLLILDQSIVQVNGNIALTQNAYLLLGTQLKIKGNLTDNNSSLNWEDGFRRGLLTYSGSTLSLNGTSTQTITVGTPEINLGGFTLDKASGNFQPAKAMICTGNVTLQTGTWGIGTSGLTHTIEGNFTIGSSGIWNDNTGTIKFTGNQNSYVSISGTAHLKNLWIDKTVASGIFYNVTLTSNLSLDTAGTVTIDGGTLNTGAYTLQAKGDVNINSDGKLAIAAGGILKMLSGSAINVNSGGTLSATGNVSSPATLTRITGNYNLNVNSGGTISAERAIFEYTAANGVYVLSGGLVDTAHPFSYCTFRYGYSSGTLLRIDNAQNIVIDHASFPSGATSQNNVSKTTNQGTLQFTNETGDWAGTLHESDPYFRINWSSDVPQIQVNPATFNFGEVPYTQSSSRHMLITNPGSAMLYGTITTPPNFSIAPWGRPIALQAAAEAKPGFEPVRNTLDFAVAIGSSNEFVITFTPAEPIYYSGTIVITHNAANSPFNVYVDGYGSGARLAVDHTFFNIDIQPGETAHRLLNLSNTGVDSLSYSGWVSYSRNDRSTLLSSGFEESFPPLGWTQQQTMGTEASWNSRSVVQNPSGNPYAVYAGSSMAYFNSYSAHGGNRARLQSPVLHLNNYTGLTLSFWMLHDEFYLAYPPDTLQVQVSTDGVTWNDAGFYILRPTMPYGWRQHSIDLSAYNLSGNFQIGFLGKSGYGNDMYIDEVQLTGNYQMPTNWITLNGTQTISGILEPDDPDLPIDIAVDATGLPSGWYLNQLRLMSNDPGNPEKTVSLNIRIGTPDFTYSPSNLNFGNVAVGETDTLSFQINNTGQIGLSGTLSTPPGYSAVLTSAPRTPNQGVFTSRNSSATRNEVDFYLYPGIAATFDLLFSPLAATAYNGQISIATNTGTTEYLPVTGAGVTLPMVSTAPVTNIGVTTATGGGNVTSTGNLPLLERGICWYYLDNPTIDYYHATSPGAEGEFTVNMAELLPGYNYRVRAYAINALGIAYGNQVLFDTPGPTIVANPDSLPHFGAIGLGETSAAQTLSISGVSLAGSVTIFSPQGYQISLQQNSGYGLQLTVNPVNYILPATNIYVKFCPFERGAWPGALTIQTSGVDNVYVQMNGTGVVLPTVETATVVYITAESATVNCHIIDDGDDPVDYSGVVYGLYPDPSIDDNIMDIGAQTGWYSTDITNLAANSTYYVRSFAVNLAGLAYGNQVQFNTLPIPQISLDTSLLNPFGSIVVGAVSAIDTLMVLAQQLMDNLLITAPAGFELSLNPLGREFGSQLSIAPVTGNIASTAVYIRFAPASGGNLSNYLSCESTGISGVSTLLNGIGITTPSLSSTPATEITFSSALAGGEIIHSGWATISACGVCYSTSSNPDLSDPNTQTLAQVGEFSTLLENLEANTTYYFRAYATNMAGTSYGQQLSFTTALGTLDAPQNLRISLSGTDLLLEWDAVLNANSYKIYRSSDPYGDWGLPYATSLVTSWLDPNPAGSYFYKVVASTE